MEVAWTDWVDAVATGVRSVPDNILQVVAKTFYKASIVLTAGNGGSSSLASHAAQALMKPDHQAGGGRAAICLTDGIPTLTAHANDGGWPSALEEAARPFLAMRPVLLLISSSGTSENIIKLAKAGRRCEIVAFTGFTGGPLRELATVSVHVDSHDYEVVEPVHDALLHRVQYLLRTKGAQ